MFVFLACNASCDLIGWNIKTLLTSLCALMKRKKIFSILLKFWKPVAASHSIDIKMCTVQIKKKSEYRNECG